MVFLPAPETLESALPPTTLDALTETDASGDDLTATPNNLHGQQQLGLSSTPEKVDERVKFDLCLTPRKRVLRETWSEPKSFPQAKLDISHSPMRSNSAMTPARILLRAAALHPGHSFDRLDLSQLPTPCRSWHAQARRKIEDMFSDPQSAERKVDSDGFDSDQPPAKRSKGEQPDFGDWSEWEDRPDCPVQVLTCFGDAALGLNTDGDSSGSVYIESVRPCTWADRMNIETPCKLVAMNGVEVRQLTQSRFNFCMQLRPVRLSFQHLRKIQKVPIEAVGLCRPVAKLVDGLAIHNGVPLDLDPLARQAPHRATSAEPVEYQIVIPTYKRWQSTRDIVGKQRSRRFENPERAFILDHTLGFLSKQGITRSRVTLFVANETEVSSYRKALQSSLWADVKIEVSAPGIRDSRNAICKFFPEGTYVVSLDDDLEGVLWKVQDNSKHSSLTFLPHGGFEKLIFDAYQQMKAKGAFLWGVNVSSNTMSMSLSGTSSRNGLVNGYLHGFISRPQCSEVLRSLCDAVEDCEFSVRHFAKDGIVLRYKMYAGKTQTYANAGGLQAKFQGLPQTHCGSASVPGSAKCSARKSEELRGAAALHELFPNLIASPDYLTRKGACALKSSNESTMQVKFKQYQTELKPRGNGRRMLKPRFAGSLSFNDRVTFQKTNPKKKGSLSYHRYQKYMHAKTPSEAREMGAQSIDLLFDLRNGFCTVQKS